MAQLQPQFTKTPANPTTDTWGFFTIGLEHGGWGNNLDVRATLDGGAPPQGNTRDTRPTGSKAFDLQFDNCPIGHHAAHFSFERGGEVLAVLDYEWDVVA